MGGSGTGGNDFSWPIGLSTIQIIEFRLYFGVNTRKYVVRYLVEATYRLVDTVDI